MKRPRTRLRFTLLVAATTIAACSSPTQVSSPQGLTLTLPALTVGTQAHFAASVHASDGVLTDVSGQVTWTTNPTGILSINATGLATGVASGTTTVTATYQGLTASQQVQVGAATYAVSGSVTDAGAGVLTNATVTATAGGNTQQAMTNSEGNFSFSGLPAGSVQLQATASGFQSNTVTITLTANTPGVTIPLTPTTPPVDVSGNWTMALAAPPGCASTLPSNERTTSLIAAIAQRDTQLTITLLGNLPPGSSVSGTMIGSAFSADLPEDDYYGALSGVALEQLGPTQWLGVFGTLAGNVPASTSSFSATFTGRFNDYETGGPNESPLNPPATSCSGTSTVTFTRGGSTAAHRRR